MRRFLLLAVTLGLVAAAPVPEKKDELKKFEGNWVFASWDQSGTLLPEETLRKILHDNAATLYHLEPLGSE